MPGPVSLPGHFIRRDTLENADGLEDCYRAIADRVHPRNLALQQGQSIAVRAWGQDHIMQSITNVLATLKCEKKQKNRSN